MGKFLCFLLRREPIIKGFLFLLAYLISYQFGVAEFPPSKVKISPVIHSDKSKNFAACVTSFISPRRERGVCFFQELTPSGQELSMPGREINPRRKAFDLVGASSTAADRVNDSSAAFDAP